VHLVRQALRFVMLDLFFQEIAEFRNEILEFGGILFAARLFSEFSPISHDPQVAIRHDGSPLFPSRLQLL
jgi:hypothetical protein